MTAPADSREAFEAWVREHFKYPNLDIDPRYPGFYADKMTAGAWEAWQEAITHQGPVVPVSVLEGQIGRMAVSKASAEGASGDYMDGYADACRHFIGGLRAIIEKGEV